MNEFIKDEDYFQILNSLSLMDIENDNEHIYKIKDSIKYLKLYDYLAKPLLSNKLEYLNYYFYEGVGIELIKRIMGPIPSEDSIFSEGEDLDELRNLALGIKLLGALSYSLSIKTDIKEVLDYQIQFNQLLPSLFNNWWLYCIQSIQPILRDTALFALFTGLENTYLIECILKSETFPTYFSCLLFDESCFVATQAFKFYSKCLHLSVVNGETPVYNELLRELNLEIINFQKALIENDNLSQANNIKVKLDLIWYLCHPEININMKDNYNIYILVSDTIKELGLLNELWIIWKLEETWLKSQAAETLNYLMKLLPNLSCINSIILNEEIDNSNEDECFLLINNCANFILNGLKENEIEDNIVINFMDLYNQTAIKSSPYLNILNRLSIIRFIDCLSSIFENHQLKQKINLKQLFYTLYDLFVIVIQFITYPKEFIGEGIKFHKDSKVSETQWKELLTLRNEFWIYTRHEESAASKRQDIIYYTWSALNSLLTHALSEKDMELDILPMIQLIEYHLIQCTYNEQLIIYKTPQYLIAGLKLMPTTLKFNNNDNNKSPFIIFHKIVLNLLSNPSLNIPTLNCIYDSLKTGISLKPELYLNNGEETKCLLTSIQMKIISESWEVRDSTILFIGKLFEINTTIIISKEMEFKTWDFAIKNGLYQFVIKLLINENIPQVLASCYKALSMIVNNPYISTEFILGIENELNDNGKLEFDYEANVYNNFQRKHHLYLLNELLQFHYKNIGNIPLFYQDSMYLSINQIYHLSYDEDSEIIVAICNFIFNCWKLAVANDTIYDTPNETKKLKLNHSIIDKETNSMEEGLFDTDYFFQSKLHTLLIDKLNDPTRTVREKAFKLTKEIEFECKENCNLLKEKRMNTNYYRSYEIFLQSLIELNWDQLYKKCDPNSLYSDAFELSHLKLKNVLKKDEKFKLKEVNPNVLRNSTFRQLKGDSERHKDIIVPDFKGWFTSDSELDEIDAECYNVMDCD
ncbi:hypothetical protein K502DRAFT_324821 [Neoconidiobolus thromboides FSU 785]|nr:hypothetical protein K502DRAFT_324821 [Neoconidiobolus thromboides FSU 785]